MGYSMACVHRQLFLISLTALTFVSGLRAQLVNPSHELKKTPFLSLRMREEFPVNLAQANLGAEITSTRKTDLVESVLGTLEGEDGNKSEFGLISADSSISYPLPVGDTSFIVRLPFLSANDQFTFMATNGGEGTVTVSMASSPLDFGDAKWRQVAKPHPFSGSGSVQVKFPMTEGLVVKIDFKMSKAGRIAGFGIFGETRNTGLVEKPQQVKETQPISQIVNYDYADMATNISNVSHVSSKGKEKDLAQANNMIDGNINSYYEFDPADPTPIAVVDLGFTESIRRITANYESAPGKIEFYVLNKLPNTNEEVQNDGQGPQLLILPPDFFEKNKPFRVTDADPDKRRSSTTFDLTPMRYIMLRYVPEGYRPGAAALNLSQDPSTYLAASPGSLLPLFLAQTLSSPLPAFRIIEVNAFGNTVRRRYALDRSRERRLSEATNPETNIPKDPPTLPPPPTPPPVSP
ncbi:MAG: hypothetical protein HC904_11805 [Blastochloris sp.]|nr:hypothetical protein [Blastochloris sp.]